MSEERAEGAERAHGIKRPAPEGRQTLSNQLRGLIRGAIDRGGTLHALARDADLDPKVLGRFLRGDRGLSLASADRVGLALGLHLGERIGPARGRGKAKVRK